jgi:hypothetical protein
MRLRLVSNNNQKLPSVDTIACSSLSPVNFDPHMVEVEGAPFRTATDICSGTEKLLKTIAEKNKLNPIPLEVHLRCHGKHWPARSAHTQNLSRTPTCVWYI